MTPLAIPVDRLTSARPTAADLRVAAHLSRTRARDHYNDARTAFLEAGDTASRGTTRPRGCSKNRRRALSACPVGRSPFIPYDQLLDAAESEGTHRMTVPAARTRSARLFRRRRWSGSSLAPPWRAIGRRFWVPSAMAGATGEQLATSWPGRGPTVVWQTRVGRGFAGVAVQKGRLILFHREGNRTGGRGPGRRHGQLAMEDGFSDNAMQAASPSDDGPRCVPLIDNDRVYLLGPGGELACLSTRIGQASLASEYLSGLQGARGLLRHGQQPDRRGRQTTVERGRTSGAGLVAFSPADGKTLWKATDEAASYSSPVGRHGRRACGTSCSSRA